MSQIYYTVHGTPSRKKYEVSVFEHEYSQLYTVEIFRSLPRLWFFSPKELISSVEYLSRKEAFDNANAIATSQLITEQ